MPRIALEFSDGLQDTHDMQALCDALFEALILDPEITPAALKVHAAPVPYWRIGTEPQTFAHVTFYLYAGRDDETKARLTEIVLTTMNTHMPTVGSLSVDARDMNPAAYTKRVRG